LPEEAVFICLDLSNSMGGPAAFQVESAAIKAVVLDGSEMRTTMTMGTRVTAT
jgi:hypothetical protein